MTLDMCWERFNLLRRKTRREAFRLFRTLRRPSTVVPFIVGIDAANLELATPPEVFAPSFRFLRELPIELNQPDALDFEAHRLLSDLRTLTEGRRLSMTYHVGEDFRHLLSGLRAIDEVVEFLKPQPGDRLGHAIALGLKPNDWAQQAGFQALVPRLEWLDTLVWTHHVLGPGHELLGDLGIDESIQRLGWMVYGAGLFFGKEEIGRRRYKFGSYQRLEYGTPTDFRDFFSPLLLFDAWRLRQLDPATVDLRPREKDAIRFHPLAGDSAAHWRWNLMQHKVLSEVTRDIGSSRAFELLAHYWYSSTVRKEGAKLEMVDMQGKADTWIELCKEVQSRIQERVRRRQLVVEVNPTVNRMIGPMARLDQHHIFQLSLNKENRLKRNIWITINTDNPGVFNTSLAHEYYLLGESLIRQGVPEAEVVEWLEWMRQNGEDFSFLRQLPDISDSSAMRRVLKHLQSRRRGVARAAGRSQYFRDFWSWMVDKKFSDSLVSSQPI